MMSVLPRIGAVVIGRNEGERLRRCLMSLQSGFHQIVYVDSGSSDNSVEAARRLGAEVVELDLSKPFTAARARNAGAEVLLSDGDIEFIHFIDGDCEMMPEWPAIALAHLMAHPKTAVVCGRRRERFPEASIFNHMCDVEWNTPIGKAKACGGDALMRVSAFRQVDGFNPGLIAGEEPDLCVRLRAEGWDVWRLDHEMTLHDAAMSRFSQWWKRMRRGGFAFAQGAALHGAPPERHWVAETRRALVWGVILPCAILVVALISTPILCALALIYPLQLLRLTRKFSTEKHPFKQAIFSLIGKFAEAQGVLEFHLKSRLGKQAQLIEYK